jgi:predicted DsbA family dithiol-disulfide isomerase
LIFIAPEETRGELSAAIYEAYFRKGKDITDLETLVDIAGAVGLDRESIRQRLLAGEGAAEVHGIARQVAQQGVTGVPFFIFDGRFALNGAQSSSVILEAIRQASEPALSPAD